MAINYSELPKGYRVPRRDREGVGLVNEYVKQLVKEGKLSKSWVPLTEVERILRQKQIPKFTVEPGQKTAAELEDAVFGNWGLIDRARELTRFSLRDRDIAPYSVKLGIVTPRQVGFSERECYFVLFERFDSLGFGQVISEEVVELRDKYTSQQPNTVIKPIKPYPAGVDWGEGRATDALALISAPREGLFIKPCRIYANDHFNINGHFIVRLPQSV